MAIFKILKGASSRINTQTTPFHDGYAYFTPEDSGLYIDASVNNVNQRIRINPPSVSIETSLLATGWNNGVYTLSVSGLGATQNGSIGLSQSATSEQSEAAGMALLRVSGQASGSLTITADGDVPTVNIPVTVTLLF